MFFLVNGSLALTLRCIGSENMQVRGVDALTYSSAERCDLTSGERGADLNLASGRRRLITEQAEYCKLNMIGSP